eukprot:TRINITY_DN50381_c0_g1_i1.p1 TRINITY_DN50381_c0_g1~~TRINITY_DN50381_c0_g1_i1.p1  ORF type:complete len:860 (+),score=172.99 TRINITY_DN50381_c0_g1_i1:39-2618(+)
MASRMVDRSGGLAKAAAAVAASIAMPSAASEADPRAQCRLARPLSIDNEHMEETPWKKRQRESGGTTFELEPLAKPALKTLESEARKNIMLLHERTQVDLDILFDQVHREIFAGVTKELVAVGCSVASVRKDVAEEIRGALLQEVAPIRAQLCQLQDETRREAQTIRDWQVLVDKEVRSTREEGMSIRESSQKALEEASSEMREAVKGLREALHNAETDLCTDVGGLRADLAALEGRLGETVSEGVAGKLAELEARVVEGLEVACEERSRLADALTKGHADTSDVLEHCQKELDEMRASLQAEASAGETRHREAVQATGSALIELESRLAESTRSFHSSIDQLKSDLDGQADSRLAADEAVVAQVKAATGAAVERHGDLDERITALRTTLDRRILEAELQLTRLAQGLGFAHSCWARFVEWKAEVDVEKLERDGALEVESAPFDAAGLRGLRLRLKVADGVGGRTDAGTGRRWVCGVYLCADEGHVAFRLHLGGRVQSFAADFDSTQEWGTQRIAVLDRFEGPVPGSTSKCNTLPVRLEVLDVSTKGALAWESDNKEAAPQGLRATLQIVDAAQAANKEAAALRSEAVRRVEWRVARIQERVNRARIAMEERFGDDEALEPICSPPFSAAGIEGLQFQLYPMGYRSRGDGQCGFFLLCPGGVFMKCRVWVGDAVRVFEHHFDTREPYGRGSFCRLLDKADEEDAVTCGIEILEVRHDYTMQVRGGAFGQVADQMKVTLNPNVTSMELVRELREIQDGPKEPNASSSRHRHGRHSTSGRMRPSSPSPSPAPSPAPMAPMAPSFQDYAAATMPQCAMSSSKSLPLIVPAATITSGGASWGAATASPGLPPTARRTKGLPRI